MRVLGYTDSSYIRLGPIMVDVSSSATLSKIQGSPETKVLKEAASIALELVPFVSSYRLYNEGKHGQALFWAGADAAALAVGILPLVEGGVIGAKAAHAVSIAQKAKIAGQLQNSAKVLKAADLTKDALRVIAPVAKKIHAATDVARLEHKAKVAEKMTQKLAQSRYYRGALKTGVIEETSDGIKLTEEAKAVQEAVVKKAANGLGSSTPSL